MKYMVIYEQAHDSFGAYVPDLPGCVAVGGAFDEVRRLIRQAMKAHLDAMRRDGDDIPVATTRSEYLDLPG